MVSPEPVAVDQGGPVVGGLRAAAAVGQGGDHPVREGAHAVGQRHLPRTVPTVLQYLFYKTQRGSKICQCDKLIMNPHLPFHPDRVELAHVHHLPLRGEGLPLEVGERRRQEVLRRVPHGDEVRVVLGGPRGGVVIVVVAVVGQVLVEGQAEDPGLLGGQLGGEIQVVAAAEEEGVHRGRTPIRGLKHKKFVLFAVAAVTISCRVIV